MTSLPIKLNPGSIVTVKVGDVVSAGDILAKYVVKEDVEIDLSKAFGLNPKKIKSFVRKNPGDRVVVGDVVAGRPKLFGMREEKVLSQVEGTVSGYDRNSGKISIVLHGESDQRSNEDVHSPIDGIIELCDNDQILIKTDKNVLLGISGCGGSSEAEVYLLEEDKSSSEKLYEIVVQIHHMNTQIIDKILLGGVIDRDVLVKAIGMGVKGVIGVGIRDEDIEYVKERELGVPVISVDKEIFMKVAKWNGKKVFMNGAGKTILFLNK